MHIYIYIYCIYVLYIYILYRKSFAHFPATPPPPLRKIPPGRLPPTKFLFLPLPKKKSIPPSLSNNFQVITK